MFRLSLGFMSLCWSWLSDLFQAIVVVFCLRFPSSTSAHCLISGKRMNPIAFISQSSPLGAPITMDVHVTFRVGPLLARSFFALRYGLTHRILKNKAMSLNQQFNRLRLQYFSWLIGCIALPVWRCRWIVSLCRHKHDWKSVKPWIKPRRRRSACLKTSNVKKTHSKMF